MPPWSAGLLGPLLCCACAAPIRIQPVAVIPSPGAAPPGIFGPDAFDWSDYDLCLKRVVVNGRVDYCCAVERSGALERALARLALYGPQRTPQQFPDRAALLAYWINAYNATILRGAAELARPMVVRGEIERLVQYRPPRALDNGFIFTIDGRDRTPGELRAEAERLAGDDWRVMFALCGGHRGDPPLFREAYLGKILDHQLNETVRLAIDQPQIVTIDHGLQRLRVWRGLAEIRPRLIAAWEARHAGSQATLLNVLLDWASPQQRQVLNSAIGYAERTLPFDARLNQVPFTDPSLPAH